MESLVFFAGYQPAAILIRKLRMAVTLDRWNARLAIDHSKRLWLIRPHSLFSLYKTSFEFSTSISSSDPHISSAPPSWQSYAVYFKIYYFSICDNADIIVACGETVKHSSRLRSRKRRRNEYNREKCISLVHNRHCLLFSYKLIKSLLVFVFLFFEEGIWKIFLLVSTSFFPDWNI